MKFTAFVSSVALATALFAGPVLAQETHTITPRYPDHFKVRGTQVSDQSQTTSTGPEAAQTQKTHTSLVYSGDTQKSGAGFSATYDIVSFDLAVENQPAEAAMTDMVEVMRKAGPAKVTLDANMDAVRIENIEEIKARIKSGLASSASLGDAQVGTMLYDMLVAGMTPESAAALLKQNGQRGAYLNKPLTIGQPIAVGGEPLSLMGGTFRMTGTVTLIKWEEGKSARLKTVLTPTEEDLRTFIGGVIKNMLGTALQASAESQDPETTKAVTEMFDRMVEAMQMKMSMTCETDLSLVNYIESHAVCDTDTVMTIDMGQMMPHGPSDATPPVVKVTQTARQTNDIVLVN